MPNHDLVALWEAHCRYEFETRDVDATMATMVASPYVNHVPTMTGGVGHDELKRFYKYHFIGGNPPDTTLTPVSRTVGADPSGDLGTGQIVDELLFSFTHTSEVDWMLPASRRPAARSRSRWSPSCASSTARWRMSISTGIRPRCWCRSVCSIPRACRSPASRPRARSRTRRSPATRS